MGDTEEEMSDSSANTDADSDEDSSEPKGKVPVSKSKVNSFLFCLIKTKRGKSLAPILTEPVRKKCDLS